MQSNALQVSSADLPYFDRRAIESRLRRGSPEQIGQALKILGATWPNIRAKGEAGREQDDLRVAGYVLALQEFGLETIKACVRAAVAGKVGLNPGFMPLAPEMAAWCRDYERHDYEALSRLANGPIRVDRPDVKRPPPSAEHVAAKIEPLLKELKVTGRDEHPSNWRRGKRVA